MNIKNKLSSERIIDDIETLNVKSENKLGTNNKSRSDNSTFNLSVLLSINNLKSTGRSNGSIHSVFFLDLFFLKVV